MVAAPQRRLASVCVSRPAAAALASLVAVCLLTAVVGLGFLPHEVQKLSQRVSVSQHVPGDDDTPSVSLYWSIAENGAVGRRNHLAMHTPDDLEATVPAAWSDMRPQTMIAGAAGRQAIVGTMTGEIFVLDLEEQLAAPRLVARQPVRGVIALASSADGRTVLSQSGFDLYAWDVATGVLRWQAGDGVSQNGFCICPNGRTAVVSRLGGKVVEVDLESGEELRTLSLAAASIVSAEVSADGELLAVLDTTGMLRVVDLTTGDVRWTDKMRSGFPFTFGRFTALSPDATQLAVAGEDQGTTVVVRDARSGRRVQELRGHTKIVLGAAFGPHGELHSWAADGTVRVWDVRTGQVLKVTRMMPPVEWGEGGEVGSQRSEI